MIKSILFDYASVAVAWLLVVDMLALIQLFRFCSAPIVLHIEFCPTHHQPN